MKNFEAFNIQGIEIQPNVEVVNKRYDYVYWGKDNLFPQYLLDLKENSPIHSVAADSTVTMSYGDGVEIEGLGNVLINRTEKFSSLYRRLLYDWFLFGGYAVEVIWSKDRTSIASVYHVPFQKVRCGHLGMDQKDPDTFYFCDNWGDVRKNPIITYGEINPENREQRQMFYHKRFVPSNNDIYPVVPYQSGIPAIVLEGEIFSYHQKALENNLTPNLFVSLFGDATESERNRVKQELLDVYSGKDGQKLMLSFSSSPEEAPQITPINSTVGDGYYVDTLGYASQSVLTSWQISSPLLLGIHSFSSNPFSQNADELKVATEHWLNYILKPKIRDLNEGLEVVLAMKYNQPVEIINKFTNYFSE
jgi:hypothetical protein